MGPKDKYRIQTMVKYILRLKVTCYGLRNAKLGDLSLAELRLRVHGGAGQL